jgi:hypothetical protein
MWWGGVAWRPLRPYRIAGADSGFAFTLREPEGGMGVEETIIKNELR